MAARRILCAIQVVQALFRRFPDSRATPAAGISKQFSCPVWLGSSPRPILALFAVLAMVGSSSLLPTLARAQRYPIIPVPDSPHGIFTMMQARDSRLWLGTIDDVYCFDGTRFFSIRQYGFPKEYPNAFAEDNEGALWIATQGSAAFGGKGHGGLYRYRAGRVEEVFAADVLSIVSMGSGLMLVAVATEVDGKPAYGDLYRFRETSGTWSAERILQNVADHMTVDAEGTAVFPCPNGWCELSRQDLSSWPGGAAPVNFRQHPGAPLAERVLRDRFGCVWFRAEGSASYQCPGAATAVQIPDSISKYDLSSHLEETPNGDIFMLVHMALGRPGSFRTAGIKNGLPADMDTAIVARDGTIWIGSDSGLYRFMHPFHLEYWDQNDGPQSSFSILRRNKKIFATSDGVVSLSEDRSRWTTLPGTSSLNGTVSLLAGPNGTLVAGSAHGLAQLSTEGAILAQTGYTDGAKITAMTKDGQLWAGSVLYGTGVSKVIRHGNRLILQPEGLPRAQAWDLQYDDTRDTLWACDGPELLFRKDGIWHHITRNDGLLDLTCTLIAIQPDGNLWIGYAHNALAFIENPTSDRPIVRNYTEDLGRLAPSDSNTFLGIDRHGRLWRGAGSDSVATLSAARAGHWISLSASDGIPAGTAQSHGFSADPDGSVWFGVGSALYHFSPDDSFATAFPSPPLFISGFSIGNAKPVLAEIVASAPHAQDAVAHIGSLQFDRRGSVHLRYRLLPDDFSWHTTSGFDIPLGKPHWGDHTLQVQAQISTGPWSEVSSQSLKVLRPIWLSWPVLAGVFLGAGLGFASIYHWQKRRRARATKKLPQLAEWRVAALSPELAHVYGTVLDSRYEVGRLIARGGFATIAEGRDRAQGDAPCAIKIFRQDLLDNAWMTRRFEQEVLALEKIHHPNVVGIVGHGTTPSGAPYLVMEYVNGQTLGERLERTALPAEQAASYLRQTGSALTEIHAHGVCHRDLKPDNLMIRRDAAPEEDLVLIDFSIAIVQNPDQTMHGLSRAAGTLYYMAPEQSIGFADSSTDIYSLAKILIEMLTGKRLTTLLPDAAMDLPERVRELLIELPIDLSSASIDLISAALQFDPARRPRNAHVFATRIAADLVSIRKPN